MRSASRATSFNIRFEYFLCFFIAISPKTRQKLNRNLFIFWNVVWNFQRYSQYSTFLNFYNFHISLLKSHTAPNHNWGSVRHLTKIDLTLICNLLYKNPSTSSCFINGEPYINGDCGCVIIVTSIWYANEHLLSWRYLFLFIIPKIFIEDTLLWLVCLT